MAIDGQQLPSVTVLFVSSCGSFLRVITAMYAPFPLLR